MGFKLYVGLPGDATAGVPSGCAAIGWLKNDRTLELRLYNEADELLGVEYLSPCRAIEIGGKLTHAAHSALKHGVGADEVRFPAEAPFDG